MLRLDLDLPTEPYWVDLAQGVRVQVRPITTAIIAAAQTRAARLAREAGEELGGDVDPDFARGLAFALLVKGLARHAITAWDGVGDAYGNPLPLTADAADRLMDFDDMATAFFDRAMAPSRRVTDEGNGSGLAPRGTSVAGPDTAMAAAL